MTDAERARELIKALLLPVKAVTDAELLAVDEAAKAQAEYLKELGEGVTSIARSNDGVSVSETRSRPAFGICPAAKAILMNAGLIKSGLPRARLI